MIPPFGLIIRCKGVMSKLVLCYLLLFYFILNRALRSLTWLSFEKFIDIFLGPFGISDRPILRFEDQLIFWARLNWGDLMMFRGNYEPKVNEIFRPKKDEVVLDVGAHIGYYALKAASLVGYQGKVVAIEPNPSNIEVIKMNMKINNLDNVTPINAAVSDKNGTLRLWDYGATHLMSVIEKEGYMYIEVQALTIDSLVSNLKLSRVDWIKIDVEGAEYAVLLGASNTLRNNRLKLIIEIRKVNANDVINLLRDMGYDVTILEYYDSDLYTSKGYYNVFATNIHKM